MRNYSPVNDYAVFRAVFHENAYEKMRLPVASRTWVQKIGNQVLVRDRHENIWPVDIEVVGSALFFLGGWKSFAKHNYLDDGDVIVFWNGARTNVLDVKIYGADTGEEKGIGRRLLKLTKVRHFSDQVEEGERRRGKNKDAHFGMRNDELYESNRRGRLVDPFGKNLFLFREKPKNPFFVTWLRTGRKDTLLIPKTIVRTYNLDLPETIYLKDTKGRKWIAKLHSWKDGRKRYGGAWKSLCETNNIKEEDNVICEFIKKSGRRGIYIYCILVQVFRK